MKADFLATQSVNIAAWVPTLLFAAVFVAVTIWVLRRDSGMVSHLASLPLDEE